MEFGLYFRFLIALLLVLGLIAALAWAARRFGLASRLAPTRGGQRRLAVVEVTALDPRHKLVLLRRDRTEHLVLMGPGANLVVERGIAAPAEPGVGVMARPGHAEPEARP